jgi:hypothetical protein
VQLLTSGELIVAVVIVRRWSGRRLGRAAWAAALTVVAGLAALLLLTSSSAGGGDGLAGRCTGLPAALGAGLAGTAAVAAALAGLRAGGRRRAVLLALAAGLADSCAAVVTMAFAHVAPRGAGALAASWPAYALVVAGAGTVLLTQTAYQAGRPLLTLPVISAVTPVASAAIAAGVLGERPGHGLAGAAAAVAAVLVAGLALAWLARSVAPSGRTGQAVQQQAGERVQDLGVRVAGPVLVRGPGLQGVGQHGQHAAHGRGDQHGIPGQRPPLGRQVVQVRAEHAGVSGEPRP